MAEHRTLARANPAALALAGVAAICWIVACVQMNPANYTDLGLFAATTPAYWLALGCGVVGFVFAIRALHFRWYVVLITLVAVIAVLYATPSVIEGTARVEASFRHLGIAGDIGDSGKLRRGFDAYYNWPGFFALLGTLQQATGAPQMVALARWAPVAVMLAYIPPVLLIARSLTPQPRVQWLTVGVFLMVNWTGQDYLSPQTYAFWLLLCIAGVLMTVIRRSDDPDTVGPSARLVPPRPGDGVHRLWVGEEGSRVRLSRAQWVTVHVVVALGVIAVMASHQLTPVMLILVLFGLWLVGRSPHWWLWAGAAAFFAFWLMVPAWPFVSGHLADLFGSQGASGSANLGNRVASGSAAHKLVVNARLAQTAGVWLLAGFGTLLSIAQRRRIRAVLVLAALPFLLVPMQSYGGEMLIRAFLFSLPLVAFLVAAFLFSVTQGKMWRGVGLALIMVLLTSSNVLTRFGNERGESFGPSQLETLEWVYRQTPVGSTIVTFDQNSPAKTERYATDTWLYLNDAEPGPAWKTKPTPDQVLKTVAEHAPKGREVYFVYTPSQQTMAELSGNIEPGALDRAVTQLNQDSRFTRIYHTTGGSVWRVR